MTTNIPNSAGHTIHAFQGRIAALSPTQLWQVIAWCLSRLPYAVETSTDGTLTTRIPLTSGRSISLTPKVRVTDDEIAIFVRLDNDQQEDALEIAALTDNFMVNLVYGAQVMYFRASKAA
jgi:hypothetical protein